VAVGRGARPESRGLIDPGPIRWAPQRHGMSGLPSRGAPLLQMALWCPTCMNMLCRPVTRGSVMPI
jgi:hypothetical protein